MYLFFIYAHIWRWNCFSMSCILCSLQFEMDSISQAQILYWQEDALCNPPNNFFGKKIVMAYLFFSVKFVSTEAEKSSSYGSHWNLNQKSSDQYLYSFLDFIVIGCCPPFCSCSTYFQREETNASEHIVLCSYLIHTGKVIKVWKMPLNNIIAGIIGLSY